MKAALLEEFGGADRLRYAETPDPKPTAGEVLVRVRACALNHLDLWVAQGLPAYKIKLPHVLGNDIAGEVAQVGPGVSGVKAGSRVVVFPGRSCWNCEFCLRGQDNICESYGILGANGGWGGFAEFVAVPARNLVPMPDGMSFEAAASFPLTFLTSWHMLIGRAKLKAGQTLLVLGAGSGIGVAAIQIARLQGARVIAQSSSESKIKTALKLGADEAICSPPGDLRSRVMKITGQKGVDVVFEHVGPVLFPEALKCLKPDGILVTCGATTGPTVELDLRYIFSRELRIAGARMGPLAEFKTIVELVRLGKLKPIVDKVFPIKEARQALEYLAQRKQFGKVVLEV